MMFSLEKHIKKNGVFVIAEAGSNHEGSLATAKKLIRNAARAGADAVKFQSFTKDELFAQETYEKKLSLPSGALDAVDDICFKKSWYAPLVKLAQDKGIHFMSTPFSPAAVDDMEEAGVRLYKVASCDIQYIPLLRRLAKTKKPVILSTGLADDDDIKRALSILKHNEVALLHCVVQYPPNADMLNLAYIATLKKRYGVIAGYSDHTPSPLTPALAVSHGAKIIEKHYTVTPEKKSGDHPISVSPKGLREMLEMLRYAYAAHGRGKKVLSKQEKKELLYARRGLYLCRDMKQGEYISADELRILRPAAGLTAKSYDTVVGKKLRKNKKAYTPLRKDDV